ncbi:MAG: hypothetical protein IJH75_01725 [Mogibacterium sp.]|nr:hypothetical protein [Mogibacterium sp.]
MAFETMYAPSNNGPVTTLADALGVGETQMTVDDVSGLPAAPNVLTIGTGDDAELVLYTNIAGSILTISRGFNGTTAKAWTEGTQVGRFITAQDMSAVQHNIDELDDIKSNTGHTHAESDVTSLTTDLAALEGRDIIRVSIPSFSTMKTWYDDHITADMYVVAAVLGNPSAQTGAWTATTAAGSVTLSGSISGSTTLTLFLAKPKSDSTAS